MLGFGQNQIALQPILSYVSTLLTGEKLLGSQLILFMLPKLLSLLWLVTLRNQSTSWIMYELWMHFFKLFLKSTVS